MTSRACVFIDARDPKIRNQLMNTISCIRPPFPPKIDLVELITKHVDADSSKNSSGRAPNAFIIYRKAFVEAAQKDGYQLPMTIVSSMASQCWKNLEPGIVNEYKRLAKEANEIRNKIIPKHCRRKKRQKWNIVSFPSPTTPAASTSSSSSPSPSFSTKNKSKSMAKKRQLETKEIEPLPLPIPTFNIPYDIASQVVDRFPSSPTNSVQQQQHQQQEKLQNETESIVYQDFNFISQAEQSVMGEQIENPVNFYPFNAEVYNENFGFYLNNEPIYDSSEFLSFFDGYEIYPC